MRDDRQTLGVTHSVCRTCRRIVPAKIVTDGRDVYFEKVCREHGRAQALVCRDVNNYLRTQRYAKPAWMPREYAGTSAEPCPGGCGLCDRHEQHLCMPIVEITSRCNLNCPICISDAGRPWDLSVEQFQDMIEALIRAERQIDILNLSGGEPLLHPDLLRIVDEALARPQIVRVSISTNGLELLRQSELLRQLQQRNVVVSLQFDGFDDRVYEVLRGRCLLKEKREILARLAEAGISTSLTVTAAGGINEDQFSEILKYFFLQSHIVSLMIQPLAFSGRAAHTGTSIGRLTIPDILTLLDTAGHPCVDATDFAPLPCSDPRCFYLAYYLMLDDGGTISLNRLIDASSMMDALANRTVFGLDDEDHERLKDLIYELWSGPAGSAPDGKAVMRTLRGIMDALAASGFEPRAAFTLAERHIKAIFIHAFQDADTFDLSRVRRCCQAYPQPDGKLIPACVHNVLTREGTGS
jgi:uncharacterized radical SAM superfamily Fe-S cluster-containing enzyme